ncbi:MAG: hypothetical protein WC713_08235 [Candidatus Methylomirabilota bacterium]
MPDQDGPLVEAAKRYLLEQYGEETLAMTVTRNGVEQGSGSLAVDCTVRYGGSSSDWSKTFTFRAGRVSGMSARLR